MNSSVGIMSLILLVLLFLKIPVFVAVLGASVVYFIMTPGTDWSNSFFSHSSL